VIILVIALLILGPGKLPDVGAALGKSIREFRKASSDVADATRIDTSPLPPTPPPAPPDQPTGETQPAPPAQPTAETQPPASASTTEQTTESKS
jgi:TatA/E family protein of Tat protein translocase